jgi:hypothetical protein
VKLPQHYLGAKHGPRECRALFTTHSFESPQGAAHQSPHISHNTPFISQHLHSHYFRPLNASLLLTLNTQYPSQLSTSKSERKRPPTPSPLDKTKNEAGGAHSSGGLEKKHGQAVKDDTMQISIYFTSAGKESMDTETDGLLRE